MRSFWFLAILCCMTLIVGTAWAETSTSATNDAKSVSTESLKKSRRLFQEGLICYGNLDYHCAQKKFSGASREAPETLPKHERLEIERYLAITYIALGEEEKAENCFERMLTLNRDYHIDPERVSPKVFMLFEKVRRAWLKEHPPEPIEPVKQKTKKPSDTAKEDEKNKKPEKPAKEEKASKPLKWFEFRLACALLGGKEMETFGAGMLAGVGMLFSLSESPWFALPFVEYQTHPFSSSDTLHQLQLGSEFGYRFQFGQLHLLLPVGAGVGFIGRDGLSDEVGLGWRVHPTLHVVFNETWSLGFGLGPRGVVLLNRSGSSTYFVAGLHSALLW